MPLFTPINLASPGPIGGTTPAAITGTTITATTQVVAPDGSSSTPGFAFAGAANSGLFRSGSSIRLVIGAATTFQFFNTVSFSQVPIGFIRGSVSATGMQCEDNGGTGIWTSVSGATLNFATVGVNRVAINATGTRVGPGTTANVGGTLFDDFTDAATTSTDGTEDTLYTHTLQAGQFVTNADKIAGMFQVAIVGHAISTDRIRLYVAGTAVFDTTALNFPLNAQLTIEFEVIRVSASVLRASVAASTSSATVIAYSQYIEITGLTLANTQIVALKAIATGTNSAAGDVTAKLGTINWQPAA